MYDEIFAYLTINRHGEGTGLVNLESRVESQTPVLAEYSIVVSIYYLVLNVIFESIKIILLLVNDKLDLFIKKMYYRVNFLLRRKQLPQRRP